MHIQWTSCWVMLINAVHDEHSRGNTFFIHWSYLVYPCWSNLWGKKSSDLSTPVIGLRRSLKGQIRMHPQLFLLYIDVGHTTYSFQQILGSSLGNRGNIWPFAIESRSDPFEVSRLHHHRQGLLRQHDPRWARGFSARKIWASEDWSF